MYNNVTGHKAAGGGYITKAEIIKGRNRLKQADAQAKQRREAEEEAKQQAAAAELVRSLLSENEIQKQQQIKHYAQVRQFIDHAVRAYKGNYNMFLLAWDIANQDRYSIQDSLYRGKITLDDVLTVLAEAKQFIDNLEIYLDFSL
jgi:hypothetical protein